MKILVEFTKDFANKKKGDKESYDSMLASRFISTLKVAKVFKKSKKAPKK
jgi:hypothetical protein